MPAPKEKAYLYKFSEGVPTIHQALFGARSFTLPNGQEAPPKFSAVFLFDPQSADLRALYDLFKQVVAVRWPNIADTSKIMRPWKKGEEVIKLAQEKAALEGKTAKDMPWALGKYVMKASSKFPVALGCIDGKKIVDLTTDVLKGQYKSKFYSGVETAAVVNLVPYVTSKNELGVTAYLNEVLGTGRGVQIETGARKLASETFSGYVGNLSATNPLEDNEIPF